MRKAFLVLSVVLLTGCDNQFRKLLGNQLRADHVPAVVMIYNLTGLVSGYPCTVSLTDSGFPNVQGTILESATSSDTRQVAGTITDTGFSFKDDRAHWTVTRDLGGASYTLTHYTNGLDILLASGTVHLQ